MMPPCPYCGRILVTATEAALEPFGAVARIQAHTATHERQLRNAGADLAHRAELHANGIELGPSGRALTPMLLRYEQEMWT